MTLPQTTCAWWRVFFSLWPREQRQTHVYFSPYVFQGLDKHLVYSICPRPTLLWRRVRKGWSRESILQRYVFIIVSQLVNSSPSIYPSFYNQLKPSRPVPSSRQVSHSDTGGRDNLCAMKDKMIALDHDFILLITWVYDADPGKTVRYISTRPSLVWGCC